MADFTQGLPQKEPTPQYTGLSEGLRASPNTALGSLFEGLAGTLDAGVKAVDEKIQQDIKEDIFDEVDAVQNEFGVGDATDLQGDAESKKANLPIALNRAGDQLDRLQAAYVSGDLKESHYWARLNSMVRQLRAKYPGYREQIDTMVSGVTGAKPANALRAALFDEWQAEKAGSGSKADEEAKFVNAHLQYVPADYFQRLEQGNPYALNEVRAYVASREREAALVTDGRARLGYASDQQTANKEQYVKQYRTEVNQMVTRTLMDTTSQLGGTYKDVVQQLQRAQAAMAAGNPLPQAEVDQMRGQLGQLRVGLSMAMDRSFSEVWDTDPSHSYMTQLDTKDREEAKAAALAPIDLIEQALDAKNPYGILGAVAAWTEAQKQDDTRDMLKDIPAMRTMQALNNVFGANTASMVQALVPKVASAFEQSLIDYFNAQSAMGEGSVNDAMAAGLQKGASADYYGALTQSWANTIRNKDVPLEVKQNKVQYMFGEGGYKAMQLMSPEAKMEYFTRAASPLISKSMIELKREGDEKSWNTYQSWVANQFFALFKENVQSIQELASESGMTSIPDAYRVTFNPETSQFKAELKITGDTYVNKPFDGYIRELNRALQVVRPIMTEGKADPSKEMFLILRQMGYDPSQPKEAPMNLRPLLKAVLDSVRANVKSSGGTGLMTPLGEVTGQGAE